MVAQRSASGGYGAARGDFVTCDRFIAQGLFRLQTHLAPLHDTAAPAPAVRQDQEDRWQAYAARHEWRFDDRHARPRAKRLLQQERVIARLLCGDPDVRGVSAPVGCLEALLPILLITETSSRTRTTRADKWRAVGASEQDTRATLHLCAPFCETPVSVDAAVKMNATDDDALVTLRLLGVGTGWSDSLADAPWYTFPHRPRIDPRRLGSLGDWTYRAAHDMLRGGDVSDVDGQPDTWVTFLGGPARSGERSVPAPTDEQVEPVELTDDDKVTIAEAARELHLTPTAIRQRVRRNHLQQLPSGRTHLVFLGEVRAAG